MVSRALVTGLCGFGLMAAYVIPLVSGQTPPLPGVVVNDGAARPTTTRSFALEVNGVRGTPPRAKEGLQVAIWEFPFLGRPASRVAHGFLEQGSSTWARDGLRLSLEAGALDDGKAGGRDLVEVLRPALRRALLARLKRSNWLERAFIDVLVGTLDGVELRLRSVAGALRVHVRVRFVHGGQLLVVDAHARIEVGLRGGRPHLEASEVITLVEAPESPAGRALLGLPALRARVAREVLSRQLPSRVRQAVQEALKALHALLARLAERETNVVVLSDSLRMRWRLSGLAADTAGLRAAFDVTAEGEKSRAGAVDWRTLSRCLPSGSSLRLGISTPLLNAILSHLCRRGAFDRVAGGLELASLLPQQLASLLSFEIKGATLRRPPQLIQTARGWSLAISGLRLELSPGRGRPSRVPRRVDLHGWADLRVGKPRGQALRLLLQPRELVPSCGTGRVHDPLRPCLESLVGLARRWIVDNGTIDSGVAMGAAWDRWIPLGEGLGLRLRADARQVRLDRDVDGVIVCGALRFGGS